MTTAGSGRAMAPHHSVSVAGVIVDTDSRMLVIQRRDNGRWEPPGGILELDEDIPAGLRREVHEETGLKVEPRQLTGVYKHMRLGVVALVFRCHATGGTLTVNDEATAFQWITVEEIPIHLDDVFAVRLQDALSDSTQVRAHDGTQLLTVSQA